MPTTNGPLTRCTASYHAEWHWPSFNSSELGVVIEHDGGWKTSPAQGEAVLFLERREG
ncbi:MAG: hypothetical protein ACYDBB_06325 [Armatimonadota bacterium]